MSHGPKMYPDVLPDAVRENPKFSAECQVYDALDGSAALAGAAVYHSCRWHADVNGMRRDGEADFLVTHPVWGFLSLEVKGGRVGFDRQSDSWTSTDRNNVVHGISDPFKQAAKSKRVVLEYLRENWSGRMPFINARHGVIFPHSEDAGRLDLLPAYAPADIVACSEHMEKLGARVAQMMIIDHGELRTPEPLGAAGMKVLDGFRGHDVDLGPLPATQVSTVDRRVVELTSLQMRYLILLGRQPVAVLEGGAGTGKTMIAMEQARRWAQDGKEVLLLCFNKPLAVALKGALADTAVGVSTFHDFSMRTAEVHGVDMISERRSYPKTWLDRLPGHIEDVALAGPQKFYDAILIDEAQDFKRGWIEALRMFGKSDARFWCFQDDAQNVQLGENCLEILKVHPFALHENVRNSRPIFEASEPLRLGPRQSCLGPDGPDVERISCKRSDAIKAIGRTLNRLLTADRIPENQIAVLVEHGSTASEIRDLISDRQTVDAEGAWGDGLVIDTVRRFKGLDRPVVILATDGRDGALNYVGYTRARGRLIVIEIG